MAVKEKKIAARAAAPAVSSEGWRRVKFSDVVRDVKVTVDPETSGLERYVAGEHMNTDDLHVRHWGTIGDGYLGPAFHRKFVKGQVLYGSRRTYLRKVAVAEFDGICANTTFVLEPKDDELLPELLPFVMQTDSFNSHAVKQSRGSVNPYVNWKDIAWYEFMLPPKEEQRRIADILWAADEAVMKSETVIDSIIKLKKVVLNNSYESISAPLVEIGEYAEFVTSGSRGWAQYYSSEGSIFIRVTNLTREHANIDLTDLQYVSPPPNAEGVRTRVFPGDVLISVTADLGRIAVVPKDFPEAYMNQHVALVRLNAKEMNPYYVAHCLLSSEGQKQFHTLNDAGAKAGMNLQNVRRLQVPKIPLSKQNTLVKQVRGLDESGNQARSHLRMQAKLKKELLSLLSPHGISSNV